MPGVFDPRGIGPLPPFLAATPCGAVARVRMPTGDPMWLVTDHAVGRAALADPRLSRAAAARPDAPKWGSVDLSPNSVMSLDGADHARLRRIAAGAFTGPRVAARGPVVEEAADSLLDRMEAAGPGADLIGGYASPLPMVALGALLGVPVADRPVFEGAVRALFGMTPQGVRGRGRHVLTLARYMSALLAAKSAAPGPDLLSALVRAEEAGEVSRTESVNLGLALLMAGYETTAHQLGLAVLDLLTGGGSWEESLRRSPSTPLSFPRVAVEDLVLGDTAVRRGEAVVVSLLHCNQDARQAPHLTFGHGPHRCPGAPLVVLQLRTALARLRHRFPALRLSPRQDAVVWHEGLATRGLSRLLVEW
ncbi:cytochrome P450 [Streptomyces niveiscabiei]|uniref:cytochrome P450 n=1 Tax=Streptomyces niveiscabiei TaxID=164115 RepID=UPI0006EBC053|nr:cytochrome P450 [Streptomyces niveiscabiei]